MQLEVGRSYIRRDGKTAIARYRRLTTVMYPWIVEHPNGIDETHNDNGKILECEENDADLIRPADEPAPVVVEVGGVYEDESGVIKWITNAADTAYIVHALWVDKRRGLCTSAFTINGRYFASVEKHELDIVGRWKEPEPAIIDAPGVYQCREKEAWAEIVRTENGRWSGYVHFRDDTFPCEWEPSGCGAGGAANDWWITGKKPIEPPTPQPWDSPEDVPMPTCWIRHVESRDIVLLVLESHELGVGLNGKFLRWKELSNREHSTDGREWKPCVKGGRA